MPAGYAHLMITEKALDAFRKDETIDKQLRGNVLRSSHFVQLGSLGPDYPYLDFLQPGQKMWADHMHYDFTGDLIKTFVLALAELSRSGTTRNDFIIPFCWVLGYISHVTADLVVHPIVFNIVGPYKGNEAEHRHCEMIQDVFIYNKIRNGAEIKHTDLLTVVKNASDPADKNKIHSLLQAFWSNSLFKLFKQDYGTPPQVDDWHLQFAKWLGFAGRPLFVGRVLDQEHKFTYKLSSEITSDEKARFLENLPLPGGVRGTYEKDVFPKAVSEVVGKWTLLAKGLISGKADSFLTGISNCDLDTGKDVASSRLVYWRGV
jgi:hypothetical protein